jgi:hypothetical protein
MLGSSPSSCSSRTPGRVRPGSPRCRVYTGPHAQASWPYKSTALAPPSTHRTLATAASASQTLAPKAAAFVEFGARRRSAPTPRRHRRPEASPWGEKACRPQLFLSFSLSCLE